MSSEKHLAQLRQFTDLAPAAAGHPEQLTQLIKDLLADVPLDAIFQVLETAVLSNSTDQIHTVSTALRLILQEPTIGRGILLSDDFSSQIVNGLSHPHDAIRLLSVELLLANALPHQPAFLQESSTATLQAVERLIADNNGQVFAAAHKILLQFLSSSEYCSRQTRVASLRRIKAVTTETSTGVEHETIVLVRVLDLAAQVSSRSEEVAQDCFDASILEALFQLMSGDDVLVQLNVIQFIPFIAATQNGFNKLIESGIVDKLAEQAGIRQGTPPDGFLQHEALRAIAPIAARTCGSSSTRPLGDAFLEGIKSFGNEYGDVQSLGVMVEAIGAFAGSGAPESLAKVCENHAVLELWKKQLGHANVELRAMAMYSVAQALRGGSCVPDDTNVHVPTFDDGRTAITGGGLLPVHNPPERRQAAATLGKTLMLALFSQDPVKQLSEQLKKPIEEVSLGIFSVLRTVAAQDSNWGLRALFSSRDFAATIFDRTLPLGKVGMEWRFSVLDAVKRNPYFRTALPDGMQARVDKFLRRGPYVGPEASPQVATGEAA